MLHYEHIKYQQGRSDKKLLILMPNLMFVTAASLSVKPNRILCLITPRRPFLQWD